MHQLIINLSTLLDVLVLFINGWLAGHYWKVGLTWLRGILLVFTTVVFAVFATSIDPYVPTFLGYVLDIKITLPF